MEKDNYQMHGQASQDLFYSVRSHLMDIHGPGRDWREKQPQDPTMHGQICGSTCLMQRKAKQSKNVLSRNRSSTMPECYVVSSSWNQMMKNLKKHTMKNARRKLEIPMPAAMPCKTPTNCREETCRNIGNARPNMLVLSMPTNLWG